MGTLTIISFVVTSVVLVAIFAAVLWKVLDGQKFIEEITEGSPSVTNLEKEVKALSSRLDNSAKEVKFLKAELNKVSSEVKAVRALTKSETK